MGPGYELRGLLGRGGFGDVFSAWDLRLKRDIAVKALRADLIVTGGLLERFRREAEAAARLRHPNIVPIYAVGEHEGVAWFTMPLVKGESLRAVMERSGPMPIAEARRVLREAAAALAAAHEAGIVHRDIKPDNIMLEGPERRVLLMDFGIAKAVTETDGALTGTGFIVGTPQYMSPEQAAGARDLDRRSDLYSLGVVAYQMLAGRPLFDAATPQALIVDHLTTPPRPIEQLRPDLPPALAQAVMRSLEKKPEQRWDSAAELLAALDPQALPSPTQATVPIVRERARRGLPRGALVALGSTALVILAVLFGRPLVQRAAGTGQLVSWSACEQFTKTSCLRFIGAHGVDASSN